MAWVENDPMTRKRADGFLITALYAEEVSQSLTVYVDMYKNCIKEFDHLSVIYVTNLTEEKITWIDI